MQESSFRAAVAVALCILASACGGKPKVTESPPDRRPRNVADICAIYTDNPHWATAAAEAERKWDAPQEIKMAIIWRESTFRPHARPKGSSAYGYAQAIDGTWEWYRDDTGRHGERSRFVDAIDFVGWYMDKTRTMTGVPAGDAFNQYLAYHEGQQGFLNGTWRRKPELLRAARQVEDQAILYGVQRRGCPAVSRIAGGGASSRG